MPFSIELSTEISSRTDFSLLCNARGVIDAVEVGVDHGVFAREFLSRFKGNWVILVDPYEPYPEMPYDRTLDAFVAAQALAPFHGHFRFIRQRSPEAIPSVRTFIQPPGFVYIDGAHDEASCYADLVAWWDALSPDGILAGHDYDDAHRGVQRAVSRFAKERGLVVRLTHEKDFPASWYCYKQEPAKLIRRFFDEGEDDNPHA